MEIPDAQQISPGLSSWALVQAVLTGSYRAAARSLKEIHGHRVISHERIRQLSVAMGVELEKRKEAQLANVEGTRKVKYVFLEVDGLVASLQRQKRRRRIEEKLLTVHKGWKGRHPSRQEYELVNKRHFRTQDADFWEAASRYVYSLYDIDEHTVVIINGDRAPWHVVVVEPPHLWNNGVSACLEERLLAPSLLTQTDSSAHIDTDRPRCKMMFKVFWRVHGGHKYSSTRLPSGSCGMSHSNAWPGSWTDSRLTR